MVLLLRLALSTAPGCEQGPRCTIQMLLWSLEGAVSFSHGGSFSQILETSPHLPGSTGTAAYPWPCCPERNPLTSTVPYKLQAKRDGCVWRRLGDSGGGVVGGVAGLMAQGLKAWRVVWVLFQRL